MRYKLIIACVLINSVSNITLASTHGKKQQKGPCRALVQDARNVGDTLYVQWKDNEDDFDAAYTALSKSAQYLGQGAFAQQAYNKLYQEATHNYQLRGQWATEKLNGWFFKSKETSQGIITFGSNGVTFVATGTDGSSIKTGVTELKMVHRLSPHEIFLILAAGKICQELTSDNANTQLKQMGQNILNDVNRYIENFGSYRLDSDRLTLFLLSTILVQTNPSDAKKELLIQDFMKGETNWHESFVSTLYLENASDHVPQ